MTSYVVGVQIFFLVFARVLGFFIASPLWNNPLILLRFRVTLVALISYIVLPLVESTLTLNQPMDISFFWMCFIKNMVFGMVIGFLLLLFFAIFEVVGEYWGMQIGFSMSQLFDPSSGAQVPILGEVVKFLALLVFISLGGHLKIITLIVNSFSILHVKSGVMSFSAILPEFGKGMSYLFTSSIILAFTLMGSIFVATLFVGLLAKAAPQLNVMMFGMPLYMMIGFLILFFLMPNFVHFTGNYIQNIIEKAQQFILKLGG